MPSVMRVEQWPIDRPVPYPQNPRKISQAAISKVAVSLEEFGWRQPLVVDSDGVVIVGHTRLLAAKSLGYTEVPVHVAEGLTPAQAKAYRLMDNRAGDEAKWDFELLSVEFGELKGLECDLELTGFDLNELEPIMAADWQPPSIVGDLEADHRHEPHLTVAFTVEQKQIVDSAVTKLGTEQGREIDVAGGLVSICTDFLAT